MKKITYYCDRCRRMIDPLVVNLDFDELEKMSLDLCFDCARELKGVIKQFAVALQDPELETAKETEPEPAPEPKQEKKPARKRIELDLGKIGALREAGWSIGKIAEEIGCSAATIANHLNEAMEFLRKRREKQGLERREE